MKRFIITLVVLGLLGGGGYQLFTYLSEQGDAKKAQRIRTDISKRRDLESVVSASGEVLPLLNSIVKSEISGRITIVKVKEGAAVRKGDPLLELDRTSLETRVREAERSLQAEQLRLDKAERNFQRLGIIRKAVCRRERVSRCADGLPVGSIELGNCASPPG